MRTLVTLAAALSIATPAAARDPVRLDVALLAGGRFPQVLNRLETGFEADLRAGISPWALPLEVVVELGYARTPQTLSAEDPRLGSSGQSYSSTLVLHDLRPGAGVAWRLRAPPARVVPYAGAIARLHLFRTDVEGSASAGFGAHAETATSAGGTLLAGVRLRAGPGALLSEIALAYVPVAQRVTGDSNAGALALRLGYGVSF